MDPQVKQLTKELGEAINESLANSDQIVEVVDRIKEAGYEVSIVLDATITVKKKDELASTVNTKLL